MSEESALVRYYDKIGMVGAICSSDPGLGTQEPGFRPGYQLPPLDERLISFFKSASITLHRLGDYRGRDLNLLNLSGKRHDRRVNEGCRRRVRRELHDFSDSN